jgi:outer membrane protein OmpA-like peptidoglycan-associated protein
VRAALSVQRLMAERNLHIPPEKRQAFRIGIHLGDVIVEGDDILGDGVNIAARLEEISHAGGLCLSEAVYAAVHRHIHVAYDDAGPQKLTNISTPVRVFHVTMHAHAAGTDRTIALPAVSGSRLRMGYVAAALGVTAIVGAGTYFATRPTPHPPVIVIAHPPEIVNSPLGASAMAKLTLPAIQGPHGTSPTTQTPPAAQVSPAIGPPILFERTGVTLAQGAAVIIDQEIAFLKANPEVSVTIDGYASDDETRYGTAQALGELRARNVRRQMMVAGIEAGRLAFAGHGETPTSPDAAPQPRVVVNRR